VLAQAVDSASLADELELSVSYGLPRDYFDELARRVAVLTPEDVRARIAADLPADHEILLAIGRPDWIGAMVREAGLGELIPLE
jgi:predicted Zn-dependent peptidase